MHQTATSHRNIIKKLSTLLIIVFLLIVGILLVNTAVFFYLTNVSISAVDGMKISNGVKATLFFSVLILCLMIFVGVFSAKLPLSIRSMEKALLESEENYRQLVLYAPAGIYEINLSTDRFISANEIMCEYLGYAREELLTINASSIIADESGKQLVAERFSRIMAGEPVADTVEYKIRSRDGRVFWALINIKLHNEEGKPITVTGIAHDITKRRRMEEELRESEERYRSYIELANDGIAVVHRGKLKFVNSRLAEMMGYTVDDLESKAFAEFIPEGISPLIDNDPVGHLPGGEPAQVYESKICHKNGSTIDVEYNVGVIHVDDEPAELIIIRDITERKQDERVRKNIEAQLQQAQKMETIATLAGGIAHQFNNTLAVITGNLELLELHFPKDARIQKYVAPMKSAANRIAGLTKQLLAYARGGKYQVTTIPMNDFVRETLPLIEHAVKPSITVETDLPADSLCTRIDLTQMQMVLSGILSNASEAIGDHGTIRIKCKNEIIKDEVAKALPALEPGPYILTTIEDDGNGMDKEIQARIFEPFFTTKFQGRGLGMAAAYGIVQNHGGMIAVDSEAGMGSTVCIYLPASDEPLDEPVRQEQAFLEGSGTILVIEDEEMVMDVSRTILETLGYRVIEARTGKEAVHIAKTYDGDIDLALLDIVLPDIEGRSVYEDLMASRPTLKVIVCSGYSIDGPAREILNAGAQGFIQKPFTLATISGKIREVLAKN